MAGKWNDQYNAIVDPEGKLRGHGPVKKALHGQEPAVEYVEHGKTAGAACRSIPTPPKGKPGKSANPQSRRNPHDCDGPQASLRFTQQANQVVTQPRVRSRSGHLLDLVKNSKLGFDAQEQQELLATGIIIKTPSDNKKHQ